MKIKDICTSITDGSHNPPQGVNCSDYLMLSSKNIFDDEITIDNPRYLTESDFASEDKRTRIVSGDVLLTIVGTVGRSAVVPESAPKFVLQRSVAVLHPKSNICLSRYLMYALRAKRSFIENSAKGVAQKGIYLGAVSNIDIHIIPLTQQKVVVNSLDSAFKIIKNHECQLGALNNLIRARFVEMFGNPIDTSLRVIPLRSFIESIRYGTSQPPEFDDEGLYKFIRATNIKNGRVVEKDMLHITANEADKIQKCRLNSGELIIVRSGVNTGDTCVITNDYDGQYAGYDIIVSLKTDMLNPIFLNEMINIPEYMRTFVKPLTARSAQPHLNAQQVQSFPVIFADLKKQNEFVAFCNQIDKSKIVVQKTLEKAQLLFDSLMQQHFG